MRRSPAMGHSSSPPPADAPAYGPPPTERPDGVARAGGPPLPGRLKSHLFPPQDDTAVYTYAVVDGANTPDLLDRLYDTRRPEFVCLHSGQLTPDRVEVAPYLVKLEARHPFTDWLLLQCWGRSRCVFAQSEAELPRLRRHFRSLLTVYDPDHRPVYFRWYDPRVLRTYLPTCNAEETTTVFGPVKAYLAEDAEPVVLLRFTPQGATPAQESLILNAHARSGGRAG